LAKGSDAVRRDITRKDLRPGMVFHGTGGLSTWLVVYNGPALGKPIGYVRTMYVVIDKEIDVSFELCEFTGFKDETVWVRGALSYDPKEDVNV
jgi:hypothetical protein